MKVQPILARYGDFSALLATDQDDVYSKLRQSETTGRPLGSEAWIEQLDQQTGKILRPRKRGPKAVGETD